MPAAIASLTLSYAIEQSFFLILHSGTLLLLTTDSLSQNTLAGPAMGTPNILSLYRRDSVSSVAIQSAMNSEPNVDVSTVFCHLEYHTMGVILQNRIIPV